MSKENYSIINLSTDQKETSKRTKHYNLFFIFNSIFFGGLCLQNIIIHQLRLFTFYD